MLKLAAGLALALSLILVASIAFSGDKVVKKRGGKVVEIWKETRDGDYVVKDRRGRVTGTIESDRSGNYVFIDRGGSTSKYTDD